MRLTLRTLLAYLDDVLEPAQAREIGEKLAENKEAAQLVARIRDVIRRRRIAAPELAGPGSGPDPNLVSSYLENSLEPGRVVELEKLFMESDIHLAEVAACHKILTMVLGQPLDVSEDVRERMYALGATDAPIIDRVPTNSLGDGEPEFSHGLPDYLVKKSVWQRFPVVIASLVFGGVWLALLVSDPVLWKGERPRLAERPMEPQIIEVAIADDVKVPQPQPRRKPQQPSEPEPVQPGMVRPETEAEIVDTGPDTTTNAGAEEQPEPAAPPKVVAEPKVSVRLADVEGVSAIRDREEEQWMINTLHNSLGINAEVAAPLPYRCHMSVDKDWLLMLEPNTRIQRIADEGEMMVNFEVIRGAIIFAPTVPDPKPMLIGLRVGQHQWWVTLQGAETRFGAQAIPPQPSGPPGDEGNLRYEGGVGVYSGSVSMGLSAAEQHEIGPSLGWCAWPKMDSEFETTANIPQWLTPEGELITPSAKNLARIYSEEFLPGNTIVQSIAPVVRNRVAAISAFATSTLALLGNDHELVLALNSEHEESRLAAIQGLREWMVRDPAYAEDLLEEVERTFPDDEIPIIVRLLWGYRAQDLRSPMISRQLLDWMQHEDIAIRELAFYQVTRWSERTYNYRPLLPPPERKAAILRWEDHMKRFGAILGS